MSIESCGLGVENGRAVFLVSVGTIGELPRELKLPCPRFVLLLAYDATGADVDQLWETLNQLADAECVYLCTWGPRCEWVHDLMDELSVMRDLDLPVDRWIMTTWHDKEPLEGALDFALRLADPDDTCAEGCDAIVIANIGEVVESNELRRLISEQVSPGASGTL